MVIEYNTRSSVSNVCRYSYSYAYHGHQPYWGQYDYAAFITKTPFGPAGVAPVGTMCNHVTSCALIKDDGILTAMVIAHETGHVLGMEHDGLENSCDEASGSIMAEYATAVYNNYFFSECSRNELHARLWGYTCLLDDPYDSSSTYVPIEEYPGEKYSMTDQCRFDFGEGWDVCIHRYDTNTCDELLCHHFDDEDRCLTRYSPPLDGTKCDTHKWCIDGYCVNKPRIDGDWGGWSSWSKCSYKCGVGVTYRTRRCDNPAPVNGGAPCEGKTLEYKLCNTRDCAVKQDRRAVQCEDDLANWEFKGTKHTWLPFENRNRTLACKLTCISEKTSDVVMSKYDVRDGTPCSYDNHESICIQGECVTIGCNNNLEKPMREDVCGVCDGDNTKCDLVKGSFVESPTTAGRYQLIMNLPAGARYVEIRDMNGAGHFLAMKEKGQNYILNKKKTQSPTYDFVFAGARFVYVNEMKEEILWSKGPTLKKVSVALFWTNDVKPANITYQYYMNSLEVVESTRATPSVVDKSPTKLSETTLAPKPKPTPGSAQFTTPEMESITTLDPVLVIPDVGTNPNFIWEPVGWTECTKSCDGGKQYFRYRCRPRNSNKRVRARKCGQKGYDSKAIARDCNIQSCIPTI